MKFETKLILVERKKAKEREERNARSFGLTAERMTEIMLEVEAAEEKATADPVKYYADWSDERLAADLAETLWAIDVLADLFRGDGGNLEIVRDRLKGEQERRRNESKQTQ